MKIGIIFGGKSSEHSVSVVTGIQAYDAISKTHDVLPIFIDRSGVWRVEKWNTRPLIKKLKNGKPLSVNIEKSCFCTKFSQYRIDCALLCLHGLNGEDGSVQGLLSLMGVPYTCSDTTACAVGLDKALFKDVLTAKGYDVVEHFVVTKPEYRNDFDSVLQKAIGYGFPLIVKPARLGSSIGISVANSADELFSALKTALAYDFKAVVERKLTDFVEVNCAVISTNNGVVVSDVEEPLRSGEILDYDDKYAFDTRVSVHKIPAPIGKRKTERVRMLAQSLFCDLECRGVARVDFLVSKDKIYINEINTTPGALASYLFVTAGFTPCDVCEHLIENAINAKKERDSLSYSYDNELFATKH